MGVKFKIWLEKNGDLVLGSGRKELLGLLREHGSLNKAAKELSMSYRAAWGKIRATEGRLGWKLVKVQGRRRHMTLTPEGEDLLDRYIAFEDEAARVIGELYQRFFPRDI
ncbi:MAG: winged helix-turn-helix domain-containing protein [Thermodesulfobacteriota bacterium]